jgi:hypothetical protein
MRRYAQARRGRFVDNDAMQRPFIGANSHPNDVAFEKKG